MKTNLRDRFVLFLSVTGITIIVVLGMLSYRIARDSVVDRTFAQLKTVRNARKFQLEQYFRDRISEAVLISQSQELIRIFGELKNESKGKSSGDTVQLQDPGSYIFTNIFGRSSNRRLVLAGNDSDGFDLKPDLSGNVIAHYFSQDKQPVYFGIAMECVRNETSIVHDYETGDSLSLMYVFAPIRQNGRVIGSVGLGISAEALNTILLEQSDENGLGYSGEVYVIGSDYFMRSQSRFLEKSVMQTKVKTAPAIDVFQSNDGNSMANDYRGVSVLSSYCRLNIPGLDWAILAEIDEREALKPLYTLRNTLLFISIGIMFLLVFLSFWLSKFFTRPLLRLKTAVSQISTGQLGVQVDYTSNDELGDLAGAFNEMSSKLKEQRAEIATREQQLESERKKRILSFIDGEEKERQRLSRELHDGIGQIFVAARFQLESLSQIDEIRIHPSMLASRKLVDQGITEIRKISNGLAPAVLSELGLASALRSLCKQMEEGSGIVIKTNISDDIVPLKDMEATHLFRIVQEALSNSVKHSNASEIEVTLSGNESSVNLEIKDNGCGFNSDEATKGRGQGLSNIRERARLIGACLNIKSKTQCGTQIELSYQLKNSDGE
ncbi:MAG: hypothetical protein CVU11_08585 [Bacteroidetes bacterium HGW-Bacteroidetes-6]|jgi:signal transduction histidine kinase|nr:MAG: hypothetical protein CVU11_08585 [Bacteroidetes bacterium HGW-Bacteroidetes-6]